MSTERDIGKAEYDWFLVELAEDSITQLSDNIQLETRHLDVYSRQIALKLYEVGTLVEAMIKRIVNDTALDGFAGIDECLHKARGRGGIPDIRDYRSVLEPVFALSTKRIQFHLFAFSTDLTPFSSFANATEVSPQWWKAYNLVKHDFFQNLSKATFGQLIDAVGALFLLTMLCKSDWHLHIQYNHFLTGRLEDGRFIRDTITGTHEQLYKKLSEIFLPHLGIKELRLGGPMDIFAASRLFYGQLAHWEPPVGYRSHA